MSSKIETALLALVGALADSAALENAALIAPLRNEDLVSRLVDAGDGLAKYLNVLDGDRADPEEMLGTDFASVTGYDIVWHARIEFAVAGGTSSAREAAFDAMRTAIWDAIKPVVAGGSVTYLGGAVDSLRLVDMLPPDKSTVAQAGLPNVKASDFVVELTFTSDRPF